MKRRIGLSALLLLGVLVITSAPLLSAEDAPAVVSATSTGELGVPQSVQLLMFHQSAFDAIGQPERDMEEEIEQPDRRGLPQNPASPRAAHRPELAPDSKVAPGNHTESPQTVGVNFTAATLSGINPTLSFPPDCMGAVGPSQFVVFVNGRLVTFNKTTGVADAVLNADPDVFFASVRNGSITSDPRIRYDRLSGRWILAIINVSTPNRILLAVSDAASNGTISLTTVFTFFFIDIATTPPAISNTCLADYPTMGVDANALYIGTNNFCGSPSQTYNSSDGYVIRKSSVLGAGPLILTVFRGLVANASAVGPYTPQGVDNFDPTSNEGFFIGVDNATFGTLIMRRIATPGGTPTVSANIPITVPTTQFPILVQHLGNAGGNNGRLSSLDDRLFAAHIRNGRLWTAHNIAVNNTGVASGTLTRDGSRWYELNVPPTSGTPTIVQSGTVFTATGTNLTTERNYWIPSVVVSGQGHAALGFSTAGSNERANSATVGRLAGDGLGTTQTPVLYTASATAYNPPSDPGGGSGRRWGDYSYTSVDPLDDMTMWTVQMFCNAANSYGVRVAKLIAPLPATPSSIPDVTAGQNPVNVTLTGVAVAGSGYFDPGANLAGVPAFSHLSVAASNGAATGTPPTVVSATYVNPTTINLVLNAAAATANVGAEKYTLTVTNPDGQTAAAAVLHVVGGTPVATIAPGPSLAEGNALTTAFNFTVNLTSPATSAVTIGYQTSDGSATTADNDYVADTNTIIIPISGTSGVISVAVNGDNKFEPNETFAVTLTSATNATLGATVASTGTIVNDDSQPVIDIVATVSSAESNAGTTPFVFNVSLSNPSSSTVTANFQAADGSATLADNDYQAASGTVTINAGLVAGSATVNVVGDTKFEGGETFTVTLSSPGGGTLGNTVSTGTILNDDVPPVMSIDSIAVSEGNVGTTAFGFTVSLSEPSGLPASADFGTTEGTATLANNDFAMATGSVSFAPGVVSQPVTVLVNGDATQESDELFQVDLSNLAGAQAGTLQGTGTILNDDAVPTVSIGGASIAEGDAGTANLVFTVALSNPTAQVVTVQYQTSDGTATLADNDYQAASGTLTIPAKDPSGTITVVLNGDTCGEPNEGFTVTLSSPSGAVLGTFTATGTISNDDDFVPPSVTVVAPNGGEVVTEGAQLTVQYNASDDVAVTSVDISLSRDGGLTFPELLANAVPNTGSFVWTITGPSFPTATAFIKVAARDAGCNTGTDVSDAAFRIAEPVTSVDESGPVTQFALGQVHPNPTPGSAEVEFQLPREAQVRLSVIDVRGREVAPLVNRTMPAGRYRATWSGMTPNGPAAKGVYFVRYESGGKHFTRRLVRAQ